LAELLNCLPNLSIILTGIISLSGRGAEHVDQLGNSLAIILDLPDKERAEKILQYFKDHHWRLYHWKKGKKGWGKYNPAGSTDFDRPWLAGDNDFNPSFKSWAWDINPDNFSNCGNYNYCISPYCIGWEIEAHFKIGQDKDALDLTRRCFGNMEKKGQELFGSIFITLENQDMS